LEAVIVNGYAPAVPAAGVPDRVAVPLSLSANVTPEGSVAPGSASAMPPSSGNPVVVTVKLPAWPTVNVAVAALVTAGPWSTVKRKVWVAAVPVPLSAVMVTG